MVDHHKRDSPLRKANTGDTMKEGKKLLVHEDGFIDTETKLMFDLLDDEYFGIISQISEMQKEGSCTTKFAIHALYRRAEKGQMDSSLKPSIRYARTKAKRKGQ